MGEFILNMNSNNNFNGFRQTSFVNENANSAADGLIRILFMRGLW